MRDTPATHRIYELLPAIFRMRDADLGRQLQALVDAVQVQADGFVADIAHLYDNWFIETCDDEIVPYFADLVGLRLGSSLRASDDPATAAADAVWRRRQVANAIADRRRKGTFAVLEQLAADATGWPARALELGLLAMATQSVRFPDVGRRALIDTRDGHGIELIGTPLSDAAPLPDMRRPASRRTPGIARPGSVVVWLWRLAAERVQRAPAAPVSDDGCYAFDQLGGSVQLAVQPAARSAATPITGLDVALPITRLAMARRLEDYYGPARSICVYRGHELVPRSEILVADLAGVTPRTRAGHVTIDPEVGRIAFPARNAPEDGVYVTYSRLGIGAVGGGGFARPLRPAEHVYRVAERTIGAHRTVGAALKAWRDASRTGPMHAATIEIIDDGVYEERFEIELRPGEHLEIRAAQGRRPILVPAETPGNRSDRLRVRGLREEAAEGARGSRETQEASLRPPVLVLDGIWIARRPLELSGHLGGVTLRHCTLVPAGGPPHAGSEQRRQAASLIVEAERCPISVLASVLGRIRVDSPESGFDPIPLTVSDSILDASVPGGRALHGANERPAWVVLSLQRVTVLGGAHVHSAALVEDSILTAPLECGRRQRGTIRYSYIPLGSHTPRRSRCQPDDGLAVAAATAAEQPAAERLLALDHALHRLQPSFDSVAFGDPAYGRLASGAAPELTAGAHDEGELGAYHGLWQALRLADLTTRLEEFTPAGADIDIRFAS